MLGVSVIRAYDAIREVTSSPEAGLEMPELIRTSNMRKYMASMLQALNTTDAERQWVLDHMGQTMNVHSIHYRQTSDVLERVDVAKILLIQDLGLVSKYTGKRLEDIQIEDVFNQAAEHKLRPADETDVQDILATMTGNGDGEFIPDIPEDDFDEDEEEDSLTKKRKKPVQSYRQRWSSEEVNKLFDLFDSEFLSNCVPNPKKVKAMMKKSEQNGGHIFKRRNELITKKLSNMMKKR